MAESPANKLLEKMSNLISSASSDPLSPSCTSAQLNSTLQSQLNISFECTSLKDIKTKIHETCVTTQNYSNQVSFQESVPYSGDASYGGYVSYSGTVSFYESVDCGHKHIYYSCPGGSHVVREYDDFCQRCGRKNEGLWKNRISWCEKGGQNCTVSVSGSKSYSGSQYYSGSTPFSGSVSKCFSKAVNCSHEVHKCSCDLLASMVMNMREILKENQLLKSQNDFFKETWDKMKEIQKELEAEIAKLMRSQEKVKILITKYQNIAALTKKEPEAEGQKMLDIFSKTDCNEEKTLFLVTKLGEVEYRFRSNLVEILKKEGKNSPTIEELQDLLK